MKDVPAIGDPPPLDRTGDLVSTIHRAFSQVVGLFLLAATVVLWARIFGLDWGLGSSFAEARPAVRSNMAALAALLPIAALGMWQASAWGVILWLLAVALHVVGVLLGWSEGRHVGPVLGFHLVSLSLLVVVETARAWDGRRRRRKLNGA